jgi:ubiquinone/menaquinone biosynthesis C-methylase UbiE
MEINLLSKYPKTQRDLSKRLETKSEENRAIARQFGRDFFDGTRDTGYGGYSYNPRFWRDVTKEMISWYELGCGAKILDVGCGKGFMLYDFKWNKPDLVISGLDISEYAIENALPEVKPYVTTGNAKDLSAYANKTFDLVVSINTVHNLEKEECGRALAEIERVGKNKFITVDAWNTDEEKDRMAAWNLTAKTMMSTKDWISFFGSVGYRGDYYWFIP